MIHWSSRKTADAHPASGYRADSEQGFCFLFTSEVGICSDGKVCEHMRGHLVDELFRVVLVCFLGQVLGTLGLHGMTGTGPPCLLRARDTFTTIHERPHTHAHINQAHVTTTTCSKNSHALFADKICDTPNTVGP